MDITRIETLGITQPGNLKASPELPGSGGSFGALLQQAVDRVNGLQHDADAAARAFALGQAPNIHDTMITMEKADLSLRLTAKVRNKVVDAYQEIMRMQV